MELKPFKIVSFATKPPKGGIPRIDKKPAAKTNNKNSELKSLKISMVSFSKFFSRIWRERNNKTFAREWTAIRKTAPAYHCLVFC